MTDHDLPTRTEGEGETLDMPEGLPSFSRTVGSRSRARCRGALAGMG